MGCREGQVRCQVLSWYGGNIRDKMAKPTLMGIWNKNLSLGDSKTVLNPTSSLWILYFTGGGERKAFLMYFRGFTARRAMNTHSLGKITQGVLQGKKPWKFKRESEIAAELQAEKSEKGQYLFDHCKGLGQGQNNLLAPGESTALVLEESRRGSQHEKAGTRVFWEPQQSGGPGRGSRNVAWPSGHLRLVKLQLGVKGLLEGCQTFAESLWRVGSMLWMSTWWQWGHDRSGHQHKTTHSHWKISIPSHNHGHSRLWNLGIFFLSGSWEFLHLL